MVEIHRQYVTVARAAELLNVSKSTLWRWIRQGDLPAYRFGYRRVLIKQRDLDNLITPARGEVSTLKETAPATISISPLTDQEAQAQLRAIEESQKFIERMRAERDSNPLSSSVPLIRKARQQRSRQLHGL